jgi:hypothetical protein
MKIFTGMLKVTPDGWVTRLRDTPTLFTPTKPRGGIPLEAPSVGVGSLLSYKTAKPLSSPLVIAQPLLYGASVLGAKTEISCEVLLWIP